MDTFGSAEQRLESFPRQKGAHDLAKNLGVHRTNDNMMNALSQHLTRTVKFRNKARSRVEVISDLGFEE